MKVLIGVDGSEGAFAAARQAGAWLSPQRDQIVLYCAPPEVRVKSVAQPRLREHARKAISAAIFEEATAALSEAFRGQIATIVGTQDPGRGLVMAAEECRADLIVVGARGAGPIESLLVGSVSKQVIHAARTPVLVVRSGPQPAGAPRILVAYDGAPASRRAVELLASFTWPLATSVQLLTVIEPMYAGQVPEWLERRIRDPETEAMARAWQREHQAERQARLADLEALAAGLPGPLRAATTYVAEGHAAEQILATIESERINLVALGDRGHGGWERFLIGSTAEKVIGYAPCSALVVREHEAP